MTGTTYAVDPSAAGTYVRIHRWRSADGAAHRWVFVVDAERSEILTGMSRPIPVPRGLA